MWFVVESKKAGIVERGLMLVVNNVPVFPFWLIEGVQLATYHLNDLLAVRSVAAPTESVSGFGEMASGQNISFS